MNKLEKIKELWNEEARKSFEFDSIFPLGYAGTYPDYNMQHLEMNAISKYIKPGSKVLDIGCGKGYTSLYLAWLQNISITGLDYSEEMISAANKNLDEMRSKLKGVIRFVVGNVLDSSLPKEEFDLVYTERCLINLTSWEDQQKAIENISKLLKKGGLFIMQEGSKTSLDKLNEVRSRYNLKPIEVVWHNLFFEDKSLIDFSQRIFNLKSIDNFSSMFTLISRVINPALVFPEEPSYKAKINHLALNLPNFGDYGYQKIYVFEKK